MANPSLKAQIEAAKSALASDLAAPSSMPMPREQPTASNMVISPNIASDDVTADSATNPIAANTIPVDTIPAYSKTAHATNAAALDERITQLEAKLIDNQRDLHTLLQKIREISRLQTNSGKSPKNQATDQAETKASDEARNKAEPHHSQRSPLVMIAMAALIGLVTGIAYFLATGEGDSSMLTMPNWISTIIDSFNGWIG
ncbi:hypothetical protein N8860_03005 [Alphaproteobacteria bacterium]|nr:hypothetical protein [Alphaproteobacteria bacterium]